jgi:DnaJ-class molecular chaperone
MPDQKVCSQCNGDGYQEVLTQGHGDGKETQQCMQCNGSGVTYQMTDDEERDYHADYW